MRISHTHTHTHTSKTILDKLFLPVLIFSMMLLPAKSYSQIDELYEMFSPSHSCGMDGSYYCSDVSYSFPFFPMDNDTLRVLVVYCNYADGNWDPASSYIITQHWPGSSFDEKPTWADSIICPTTTNVWHPSLTGLFQQSSNGKFWLIGDVYPDLVMIDSIEKYSPSNGRNIGYAVKDVLEQIDGNIDWSLYDKFDPYDLNSNNNRREPDGIVDFIFIIFRFNYSATTDPSSYSGISMLGGRSGSFAGEQEYKTHDGYTIKACFPGSGAIVERFIKTDLGPAAHELAQHYSYGAVHHDGLGWNNINGGGIASADDRERLGWNIQSANIYTPTSNATITLRDYITTGDYIKISRSGHTLFLENRARKNFYSSLDFRGWKWTNDDPTFPHQADSSLFVYKKFSSFVFSTEHAMGRWNWDKCGGTHYKVKRTPFYNEFVRTSPSAISGERVMDLNKKLVKDLNCNTVINQYTQTPVYKLSYVGKDGDSNTFFDIGYNQVYSPWSNPRVTVANQNDSFAVEIIGKDQNGDLEVKVYFTNITDVHPSKPLHVVGSTEPLNPMIPNDFYPRIDWEANIEPDLSYYNVYRGYVSVPGQEPSSYSYIGSTEDNYYVDNSLVLYYGQGGSGICTYQYHCYAYKVTAVDDKSQESVMSERDTVWGYTDPCAPETMPYPTTNLTEEPESFSLSQNFPNPFNPITNISFAIKEEGNVSLKIFDITGKEVAVLVNEFKAPGYYGVQFDSGKYGFSSGIYYYVLTQTSNGKLMNRSVRKMLLLK